MVCACSYKPFVVVFESVSNVAQEAFVASVVKNLPALPDCEGNASTSAQVIPPVLPDCADKKYPLLGVLLTLRLASSTTSVSYTHLTLPTICSV